MREWMFNKIYIRHGANISVLFYVYTTIGLCAFIIPENAISKYKICYEFIKFMKSFFPNIQIFASKSTLPEVVELYMGLMWLIGIIFSLYIFIYSLSLYVFFRSTDKFLLERLNRKQNIFSTILLTSAGIFSIYAYYSAYIIMNNFNIFGKDIIVLLNSRFEIFFWIYLFQLIFIISFFFITMPIPEYILKKYKEKNN